MDEIVTPIPEDITRVARMAIKHPHVSGLYLTLITPPPAANEISGRCTCVFRAYNVRGNRVILLKDTSLVLSLEIFRGGEVYQCLNGANVLHVPTCPAAGVVLMPFGHFTHRTSSHRLILDIGATNPAVRDALIGE
jgi:hypothetical protein